METTILVTGGLGYIGTHTSIELLKLNFKVVVVDNLKDNLNGSNDESLKKIEQISNKKPIFYNADIRDKAALENIFKNHQFTACIHFAGLKSVSESIKTPLNYYDNNVVGTINLLGVLEKYNCKNIIFSSSATVYGKPMILPIDEKHAKNCTTPYGRTKLFSEEILNDLYASDNSWNIVVLRYFNPVGAHKSGIVGESTNGTPNNLMPLIALAAMGKIDSLKVFGDDYKTHDGTCIRDYIHVCDLAIAHVAAIEKVKNNTGCFVHYNLGTGNGYSVLDMIKAFEKASGVKIKYTIIDRREGDVDNCYANCSKAKNELNWIAEKGLDEMCSDIWRFINKNQ